MADGEWRKEQVFVVNYRRVSAFIGGNKGFRPLTTHYSPFTQLGHQICVYLRLSAAKNQRQRTFHSYFPETGSITCCGAQSDPPP